MPNWCYTTYKCVGDKKELKEFLKILKNNSNRKTSRVKNGFGTMWLGCIIDNFGFNWENYKCRGEILDFDYDRGSNMLIINQSTAWCEQEGFRQAITQKFPNVKVYYSEEEPGCEVYGTNSFEFFPEKYLVESYINNNDDVRYLESLDSLHSYISDILKKPIEKTEKAILEAVDQSNDDFGEDGWGICIHIFEEEED